MELGLLIKNIVIIGAILGVAFLSQQPFFISKSKNYTYPEGLKNASDFIKNGISNISAKISKGASGGATITEAPIDAAKKEIENQKNNFLQNAFDSSKKFVAKEVLDILHVAPEDLGACKAN